MDVSFANRRLQELCESEKDLRRAFGSDGAEKVMRRLSDLRAATALEEMRHLPGRLHELDAERAGQLAIDVSGGRRLVIVPTAGWPGDKDRGSHVWADVDSVQVLEIADYH